MWLKYVFQFTIILIIGNSKKSDCSPCEAGYYCLGLGNKKPTAPCSAGYYCPSGQKEPTPAGLECTPGYYCKQGSPAQVLCESGTYNDVSKQSSCKVCLEGYYCTRKIGVPIVTYELYPCPEGFYCPNGTKYSNEFGCPNGTYSNATKLKDSSQCLMCPAGRYCEGQ